MCMTGKTYLPQQLEDNLPCEIAEGSYSHHRTRMVEKALRKQNIVRRSIIRQTLHGLASDRSAVGKQSTGSSKKISGERDLGNGHRLFATNGGLQTTEDTDISFSWIGKQPVPSSLLQEIPEDIRGEWGSFKGVRKTTGQAKPIAIAKAWLHPDLSHSVCEKSFNTAGLFSKIEEICGRKVLRFTQKIQARNPSQSIASVLRISLSKPVLRFLRCYYDEEDQLIEIAESHHVGDKVHFSIELGID